MNFSLPPQSYVCRPIPKNKFFEKAIVNTKLKKEFADQVQKITWMYKLAEETIGIKGTDSVEEIQIFEIQLKEQVIPKNVLRVIDKAIPYPILYVFSFEKHFAYGITVKGAGDQRYYFSPWDEERAFTFSGLNLERVYQGIVTTFIDIRRDDQDFATIVETDKKIEALEREINALQNKVKNEKQFNRKVELNKTLQDKKNERTTLTSK